MAKKTFALFTEPHEAEIGATVLLFKPEVIGDEFLDAYEPVKEARQELGDPEAMDVDELRRLNSVIRRFLADLMMPESVPVFEKTRLPDRIIVELMEWCMELYGGW